MVTLNDLLAPKLKELGCDPLGSAFGHIIWTKLTQDGPTWICDIYSDRVIVKINELSTSPWYRTQTFVAADPNFLSEAFNAIDNVI